MNIIAQQAECEVATALRQISENRTSEVVAIARTTRSKTKIGAILKHEHVLI